MFLAFQRLIFNISSKCIINRMSRIYVIKSILHWCLQAQKNNTCILYLRKCLDETYLLHPVADSEKFDKPLKITFILKFITGIVI